MYGNTGETTRVAAPVTKTNYYIIIVIIRFLFKKNPIRNIILSSLKLIVVLPLCSED